MTAPAMPAAGARSEKPLALAGRQDSEHLPVLCDGASRDVDVLRAEDLDDLLIAVGLVAGLAGDDLPDLVLDRLAGDVVTAVGARDRRVEEELQLVDALRRVHVLVRGHPRDGALVHPDVLGHVAQDERPEVGDALVEELALELDDRVGDLDDGALPLVDGADQPHRRAQLLLDVLLALRAGAVLERVAVVLRDAQLREPVVVEDGDVLVADLVDVDVRGDVLRLFAGIVAARLRIQPGEQLHRRDHFLQRNLQVAGDGLVLLRLDVFQVLADDGRQQLGVRIVLALALAVVVLGLDQQALAQIARRAADRVEALDLLQHLLRHRRGDSGLQRQQDQRIALALWLARFLLTAQRLQRFRRHRGDLYRLVRIDGRGLEHRYRGLHVRVHHQVSVAVQVADDQRTDPFLLGGQVGHAELLHEPFGETLRARERALDRRQILGAVSATRRRGVLGLVIVEVLLPVDVVALDIAFCARLEVRLGDLGSGRGQLARLDALVQGRDQLRRRFVELGLGAFLRLFQERVLLHLGTDQIDQLEPRELQELDRLLQLGSHHQLLRQSQTLLQLQRHPITPRYSSLNRSPRYTARARREAAISDGVPDSSSLPSTRSTARSQIPKVSRTAWSVMRMPSPFARRLWISRCRSCTAIGSMPAKGSSKRMNCGSARSERAISARRRSPPESVSPRALPTRSRSNSVSSSSTFCS